MALIDVNSGCATEPLKKKKNEYWPASAMRKFVTVHSLAQYGGFS
jgi:hypothetical protein